MGESHTVMLVTHLLAGSWEGDGHVGVYLPQSDILEDADTGLTAGFTLGYRVNPNIADVFGLDYIRTNVPVTIATTEADASLSIYPITLDLKLKKKVRRPGSFRPWRSGHVLYDMGCF
jgi:hypothetical protein